MGGVGLSAGMHESGDAGQGIGMGSELLANITTSNREMKGAIPM